MTQTLTIAPSLGLPESLPSASSAHGGGSKDVALIFLAITILLALVVAAVMTWGLVALAMSALALVPVILGLLVLITFG